MSPRRPSASDAPRVRIAPLPSLLAVLALGWLVVGPVAAQNFVAVTDSTNPILTESLPGSTAYSGASWVDLDDDGLLDLFMSAKGAVFRNLGGGEFERVSGVVRGQGQSLGNTWSDYDNDGDLDVYVVAGAGGFNHKGSFLYRNDGELSFTKILTGDVADSLGNTGWGCAWADFDSDGWTDLVIAAANGFGGVTHENVLFRNEAGVLSRVLGTVVTDSLDAHTVATWSDYDLDGDQDLFIGSGEVSQLDPDNHFRNRLIEDGAWSFERITTAPIATDSLNGQVWNWIDYDNDGDLDGYQTNWGSVLANNLYRNDAGTYVRMTGADVGTIVTDANFGLANNWADFDNDGDLDCLVTNGQLATCDFFVNNGDGTFTQDFATPVVQDPGPHYGASAGDYDNDGDLDLYVHGTTTTKRLFRNDLANGHSWVNLRLVGAGPPTGSNVAAIGALVRAKATIDGSPVWQMREVSAQNSFNCMNMINVHFGLKDATVIDSLEIRWPAGTVQVLENVPVDSFLTIHEGVDPTGVESLGATGSAALLGRGAPNPFLGRTSLDLALPFAGRVDLRVVDVSGRVIRTLVNGARPAGAERIVWDGRDRAGRRVAAGVYFARLRATAGNGEVREETRRLTVLR
jgi:hypothetical protein